MTKVFAMLLPAMGFAFNRPACQAELMTPVYVLMCAKASR